MALPTSDSIAEHAGTIATWISAIAVAVLAVFKGRLGIRRELRDDHAGERRKEGEDVVDETYMEIVDNLRREVARLAGIVNVLSAESAAERASRYAAEERAANAERRANDLAARVASLEQEVRQLRGDV